MTLCLVPVLTAEVHAETGYDRGYVGGMAGHGKIYAHGLDVSAWQESGLDFQNFANAGYDYVILRCGTTYGKDKCFEEYYKSARAAGLDVGCYFYSYATSVSAAQTDANNMLSYIKGKVFEYPVYFDYEDPTQQNIGASDAAKICYAFMDKLKAAGYLVGMYSMSSWLNQSWITSSGIRGSYEGWVAHLPSTADNTGITSNFYTYYHSTYCNTYGMYQYSFSTYVNGAGPYDANVCYKDYPTIVKTFGFNGYEPEETWVEKAAFDVMVYRDRNPDLAGMTDAQLKKHWLEHGIKEGRASSTVLDLDYYYKNNSDLQKSFGRDFEALYEHFVTKGYKEHRKSSALFDGSYYCEKYPDVATNYKESYMLHYIDHGMREGRRASRTYDPNYYWFVRPDVKETWPDDYAMAARHYAGHGINANIQAYDSQNPSVTDVVISDVSAAGYTITCKVTDNWGISKVVFPAWTVAGDQDDLPGAFMDTQLGKNNGNTYTFRVNASDHGNETGLYATHIYAIDLGGNQTKLVLDNVEVKNEIQKITPKVDSAYTVGSGCLLGVKPGTTADQLLSRMENEQLEALDCNGAKISGSTVVGTGAVLNLYVNGALADTAVLVVLGDMDGNGLVDATDCLRVKAAFLGEYSLTGAQKLAADVDGNGKIDSTDYLRIKEYFLGTYDIWA
jgi:hypothetical protein